VPPVAAVTCWAESANLSTCTDLSAFLNSSVEEISEIAGPVIQWSANRRQKHLRTNRTTGFVNLQSPAGIGIGGIVFNYDGDIYVFDEGRMAAETGDKTFRLGNLLSDSYEEVMLSENLMEPLAQSLPESAPMFNECAFLP
jgi:uncharacterized protein